MRHKKVMMGCLAAALIMLMAALGIIALADAAPEYTASASTNLGENISLKIVPVQGLPSAWTMAWRVGTTPVSTVNIGIQVQPTGTNVVNPRLTYYIKAVCGSNSRHIVRGDNVGVTLGSVFSNSTGSMSVDSHLQSLGVSTSQDQTVTYYIYAKLEATGAVSGQTLVAEVSEQAFSTVLYDYGVVTTSTIRPSLNSQIARLYKCTYCSSTMVAPGQPTSYTQWSASEYSNLGNVVTYTMNQVTDADYYGAVICVAHIIWLNSSVSGTIYWRGYTVCCRSDDAPATTYFYVYRWTGSSWVLNESVSPAYPDTYLITRTFSAGTYALCAGIKVQTYSGLTYYAIIQTGDVQVTYQTVDWSASWSWANQPLSLIAVPVARLMVTLSLLCLAGLILYAGRGSRISLAAALAFALLAVLLGLGVAYAAEPQTVAPMPIPDKWQAGETVIYLQSFPFPTVEYYNGTAVEKPAEVVGDLMLSLAVFNATSDMPVLIKIDGQDTWQLCGEGFYSLQCSLSPGMHSIVVYCPIKIFEEAVFYVKPKPVTPLMPLEEFLRRLEQQRNEIISRSLMAVAAAIPLGAYTKKKTLVKISPVYVFSAVPIGIGYWMMPELYMLLFFGLAFIATYHVTPDNIRKVPIILALRQQASKALNLMRIRLMRFCPDGNVLLDAGFRYWKTGFLKKAEVKVENPATINVEIEDVLNLSTGYVAEEIQTTGQVKIKCDPETALLLSQGKDGVRALAADAASAKEKLMLLEFAMPVLGIHKAYEISKKAQDGLLQPSHVDRYLSEMLKHAEEQHATQPNVQVEGGEMENGGKQG
ncbi:MAG: hypothetical protein QXR17_07740 [Candidatus Bathyarchaeia archaeon]